MSIKIEVDGIHCSSCANRITKAIQSYSPGARVDVNVEAGTVEIDAPLEREKVVSVIEGAGYPLRKAA